MRLSFSFLLLATVAMCSVIRAQAAEPVSASEPIGASEPAPISSANPPFPVDAHIDAYAKFGSDRRLGGTEAFLPLSWDGQILTFADFRFVVDDADSREVNAGLGARRVSDDGSYILGGYGFVDRRHSPTGNLYTQATAGAEVLTESWDVRANAYVPLSGDNILSSANLPASVALSGTGIIATGGTATAKETPLFGADVEVGYKLPFLAETWFEDTRAYAGAYHFDAANVEAMNGTRFRIETAPLEWLRFGAELQNDTLRGETGFVEARIRVPLDWGKTKRGPARPEGILKRLDTRIMRDVDVVTQTDTLTETRSEAVLNATTGTAQKIYVVDNTAAAGGDGSAENPFNTLTAAQAAAGAHDVIYVRRGDGTSSGMNAGITLANTGQKLIGSGVDLAFDAETMRASGIPGGVAGGTVAVPATVTPVITNTGGNGVSITGDAVEVAGLTVSGATNHGIYANANGAGQSLDNLLIRESTVSGNAGRGVYLYASGGGSISEPRVSGIRAHNNSQRGIVLHAHGAGSVLSRARVEDSETYGNTLHGLLLYAENGGSVSTPEVSGVKSYNNTQYGIYANATGAGSVVSGARVEDSEAYGNTQSGLYLYALSGGSVSTAEVSGVRAYNNTQYGIRLEAAGAGSALSGARVEDGETYGNTLSGLYLYAQSGGSVSTPEVSGVKSYNNTQYGIYALANGAGSVISGARVEDSESYGNIEHGLFLYALSGGSMSAPEVSGVTAHSNGVNGVRLAANGAGSVLSGARVEDSETYGNTQSGLYLYGIANGELHASIETVTSTGNARGVYVDDDTAGPYTVDLGGGALGSSGNNRIYGNTEADLRVDLDGGALVAEDNWWGNAAGLQPARVTLEVGSTVDSTPFLLTDPAP